MNDGQRHTITLEALATILGGSFLISYAILLVWFGVVVFAPECLLGITARWFALDRHEFDLINYSGMAFLKIINFVLFLCPYLSIKLWLRKHRLNT